jgi:hypothetical protein
MTRKNKLISASSAKKSSRETVKYKKSPEAPRRFKSAYMFFSTEKHKEIRKEMGDKEVCMIIADLNITVFLPIIRPLTEFGPRFSSCRSLPPR